MSFSAKFGEAWDHVRRAHAEGMLAHAYLIAGSPRGDGLAFAEAMIQLVLCEAKQPPCNACAACDRVRKHAHPDVEFVEPESKSRIIRVEEQMRPFLHRLAHTSYMGGWKAGVILYADRLNESSGNAFLKSLEEPPPRTLLLLVSDQPQSVLATLRSRCQTISVSVAEPQPEGTWAGPLMELLASGCGASPLDRLLFSAKLQELLDAVKKEVEAAIRADGGAVEEADPGDDEADLEASESVLKARVQAQYLRVRADMIRTALHWHRDVLACAHGAPDDVLHFRAHRSALRRQASRLAPTGAMANVRRVMDLRRRAERGVVDSATVDGFALELLAPR